MPRPNDSVRLIEHQSTRHARRVSDRSIEVVAATILVLAALTCWLAIDAFFLTDIAAAAQAPGENRGGALYAITHLHPIVYAILFVIVVLSAVNLIYQGYFARGWSVVEALINRDTASQDETAFVGPTVHPMPRHYAGAERRLAAEQEGQSAGHARMVKRAGDTLMRQPTPLDGINHTLPKLTPKGRDGQAPAENVDKPPISEFRFTSAVEVPPPDEVLRRDREQLTVTGMVCGADGKAIESVIVYLADEQGNRVGQSCRSSSGTGEFKVQVGAPGRYMLRGYKRGLIEEHSQDLILPLQAGKVEGYRLLMVPEGCTLHGKVIADPNSPPPADLAVLCVREDGPAVGPAKLDNEGSFRIAGIPPDTVCHLEIRDPNDKVLHRSETIEIGPHRELRRDLVLDMSVTEEAAIPEHATPPPTNNHEQVSGPAGPVSGPTS